MGNFPSASNEDVLNQISLDDIESALFNQSTVDYILSQVNKSGKVTVEPSEYCLTTHRRHSMVTSGIHHMQDYFASIVLIYIYI